MSSPAMATTERFAVIRADASPEIGGGHIVRCLAHAEALCREGWRCAFAAREGVGAVVPALSAAGHEVAELAAGDADNPGALAARWPTGCDLLIVDHYGLGAEFERGCRPWARRIMVIDETLARGHDCEVLLDQSLDRSQAHYRSLVPTECDVLLGPSFAPLRAQFAEARPGALARREPAGPLRRVFVSFGAADRHRLAETALAALAATALAFDIDVVTGAGDAGRAGLEDIAGDCAGHLTCHSSVSDMAGLMARADLAIGAAGTSSWERCCLGLPSLVVVTADNQAANARALETAGAIHSLGPIDDLAPEAITEGVLALERDAPRRVEMSRRAAAICDGQGARRVGERLAA